MRQISSTFVKQLLRKNCYYKSSRFTIVKVWIKLQTKYDMSLIVYAAGRDNTVIIISNVTRDIKASRTEKGHYRHTTCLCHPASPHLGPKNRLLTWKGVRGKKMDKLWWKAIGQTNDQQAASYFMLTFSFHCPFFFIAFLLYHTSFPFTCKFKGKRLDQSARLLCWF